MLHACESRSSTSEELILQTKIPRLSVCDYNGTRTHNHLFRKRTLNHLAKLAKWLSCVVCTYLYGVFDFMFLSCEVRISEWSWSNDWVLFWVFICTVHFKVCSYHITYAFQSESTIHRMFFFYILAFLVNFIYLSSLTTHYPQRQSKAKPDSFYHFSYYIVHSRDLRQLYHMINGKNITN